MLRDVKLCGGQLIVTSVNLSVHSNIKVQTFKSVVILPNYAPRVIHSYLKYSTRHYIDGIHGLQKECILQNIILVSNSVQTVQNYLSSRKVNATRSKLARVVHCIYT